MSTVTWERIADAITAAIRNGETPVGSKIPSQQQLATRHKTSVGTVKRALVSLTQAGIVEGRQGSGVYVIALPGEPRPPTLEERLAALEARMDAHERRPHPNA